MKEVSDVRNVKTGKPLDIYTELLTMRQIGWELVESLQRFGLDSTTGGVHGIMKEAEIYDNKLRFYPHAKNMYRHTELENNVVSGQEYLTEIQVDRITTGSVRLVLNSRTTDPITTAGLHSVRIVAGDEGFSGIFYEYTDAILDRFAVSEVAE